MDSDDEFNSDEYGDQGDDASIQSQSDDEANISGGSESDIQSEASLSSLPVRKRRKLV